MTDVAYDIDETRRAAADWVVRLSADDVSVDDALAFDAWLESRAENIQAYDAALAVWLEVGAAAPALAAAPAPKAANRSFRPIWAAAAGVAAAALVAVVVPSTLQGPTTESYATANGERRSVTLADGSVVDMNAGSSLTVTLARDERRVVMGEGEAVFDVAADAKRPFLIAAGDRTVRVVGTRFDVRRREGLLSVTVDRGVVEVRPSKGETGKAFRLHPGQQFERREGEAQARVGAADPAQVFSWRSGKLVVRDRPLGEVTAELNRQFARPILIDDPALAKMPVSGVLVLDNQDAVLRRLASLLPVRAIPSNEAVRLQRDSAVKP